MARAFLVVAAALLLAGCGGGGKGDAGPTVPCNDASFRAQDEELYVTHAVVKNTIAGAGDPTQVLLDLHRARKALAGYLDAHPPCEQGLRAIAATEHGAITALDEAIAAREAGNDDSEPLARAKAALERAQSALAGAR